MSPSFIVKNLASLCRSRLLALPSFLVSWRSRDAHRRVADLGDPALALMDQAARGGERGLVLCVSYGCLCCQPRVIPSCPCVAEVILGLHQRKRPSRIRLRIGRPRFDRLPQCGRRHGGSATDGQPFDGASLSRLWPWTGPTRPPSPSRHLVDSPQSRRWHPHRLRGIRPARFERGSRAFSFSPGRDTFESHPPAHAAVVARFIHSSINPPFGCANPKSAQPRLQEPFRPHRRYEPFRCAVHPRRAGRGALRPSPLNGLTCGIASDR